MHSTIVEWQVLLTLDDGRWAILLNRLDHDRGRWDMLCKRDMLEAAPIWFLTLVPPTASVFLVYGVARR